MVAQTNGRRWARGGLPRAPLALKCFLPAVLLVAGCSDDTSDVVDASAPPADAADAATDAPPPDAPPGGCVLDDLGYPDGTVNPTNSCQSCQSGAWSNADEGTSCGTDKGKVCTAGRCARGCWIDGAFHPADEQDPGNALHICLPAISGTEWTERVVIAASDSPDDWQAEAAEICTGTNDETVLNAHLTAGTMVELAPGTFHLGGYLTPDSRTRLHGQGDASVLQLVEAGVLVNADHVELDNLALTGSVGAGVPIALFITASSEGDRTDIRVHDVRATITGGSAFTVYANGAYEAGRTVSNVSFVRCSADSPDGFGFLVNGEGTTPRVENLTLYQCSAVNAGLSGVDPWVAGIDLAEYGNMGVDKAQAIACSVDGAWESAFHFEADPVKTDCVVTDCAAMNAGQKPGALYGAGYLVGSGEVVLSHNTGANNANGDLRIYDPDIGDYQDYSPPIDTVVPATSPKVVTRVSQGNCSGLMIADGTRKTLILFSSDGQPVSEAIDLGGLYAADDGDVYVFSGTEVRAEFDDYAVMRLAQR